MRGITIACALALGGAAAAAPPPTSDAHARYLEAQKLASADDNDQAIVVIRDALAASPKDLQLLELEGTVLLKLRDYEGALAAYQAYIDAGATGANRRTAQRIVTSLMIVKTTAVDITVSNGPANVYFDSKTLGLVCVADPACKKGIVPGDYKVIAERAGFERFTARLAVEPRKTAKLAITLVEKPSAVTVSVAQAGARVTIDGKPVTEPASLAGGDHELVVELAHFASERRTFAAHEGKPVALVIALAPVTPVTTSVPAELTLDGGKLAVVDGEVALPAGEHVIAAHAAGYHEARVSVPADRPAGYKIAVELAPIGALVDVAGAPGGTAVVVDGKAIATTPLAAPIELPAGTHEVELRVRGYLPWRDRRAFPANEPVHLRLSKLRPDSKRHTYMAAGGTLAAVALGLVAGKIAVDHGHEYDARAGLAGVTAADPELGSLESDGKHWAIASDAAFGLAIVGVAVTTYLWGHEGRGESEGSIQLGIGAGTAMLSGRF